MQKKTRLLSFDYIEKRKHKKSFLKRLSFKENRVKYVFKTLVKKIFVYLVLTFERIFRFFVNFTNIS
jgi:hypothetical protein